MLRFVKIVGSYPGAIPTPIRVRLASLERSSRHLRSAGGFVREPDPPLLRAFRRRLEPLRNSALYFLPGSPRRHGLLSKRPSPSEPPISPRGLSPLSERPRRWRATDRGHQPGPPTGAPSRPPGSAAVRILTEIPPRSFATLRNGWLLNAATGVASAGAFRARGRFGGVAGPGKRSGLRTLQR